MNVELRRLDAHDLDVVEVIEREAYPTPWSRSMFDAELRKPSSLALGAFTENDVLVGYAFVSRYVDAWHVMNVAVSNAFRRRGIASALLEGHSIESMAATLGVSRNTARNHVQALFRKTQTNRQSDLIRLLDRLARQ